MVRKFALLGAISIAWAAGYLFIDDADGDVRPITAAAAMAIIAAAFMIPVVTLVMRRPLFGPLRRRSWVPLVMGLSAIALPNLAVVDAERTVQPNLAALLGTTVPLLTLLFGTFVTRQVAFSPWRMLGAVIALVGLAVFVGWQNFASDGVEVRGILVMMAGGLVFALNGIFVSYEADGLDEYAFATWAVTFGAIFLTTAAFLLREPARDDARGGTRSGHWSPRASSASASPISATTRWSPAPAPISRRSTPSSSCLSARSARRSPLARRSDRQPRRRSRHRSGRPGLHDASRRGAGRRRPNGR